MMLKPPMDLATFEAKAGQVADTLKAIGNARRLMLLCKLVEHGEVTVRDLASDVGLSQSACSQHLAKLRAEGVVGTRRDGQTIFYRLTDPAAARVIDTLCDIYRGQSPPEPAV